MILHIVHQYIPYNKINPKTRKQYIFHILSKNDQNLAKKGHFLIFPKNAKASFFSTPKTVKNYQILIKGLRKKCEKPQFLGILGQKGKFCSFWPKWRKRQKLSKKRLQHFSRTYKP